VITGVDVHGWAVSKNEGYSTAVAPLLGGVTWPSCVAQFCRRSLAWSASSLFLMAGRVRQTDRMIRLPPETPRVATTADAATVARLLDAFNREFNTATPGPVVLAKRLERLLAGDATIALLAGDPAVAVAVLTLRTNVWYEGRVGLLDELYVVPGLRGQGVGSALLAAAESVTRERGGALLEINVDGQDTDARRFYERRGYRNSEAGQDQPILYYYRELTDTV
jgi:GNAT superfamily N-acetyltransferase